MLIRVEEWIQATGGELLAPQGALGAPVSGLVHDSRVVNPGCCFACIAGERADGHDFAAQAAAAGATLILAERNPFDGVPPAPVLLVPDTIKAIGQAAAWGRSRTKAKVLGVTGTAGKTTLKELLASVLSVGHRAEKNPLNLNNRIGLPVSMLNANSEADYWVFEVGISQPQDMDELGAILTPDLAVVLNVGAGHMEGLGSKGVAAHKARLLAYLTPGGFGLINAAYPDLVREARSITPRVIFFSADGKPVDYRAAYAGPGGNQQGRYRVWMDGEIFEITAPFRGAFWAENIAAVTAAAHLCGLSSQAIIEGIATAQLPQQRFVACRAGTFLAIDDTYNANPLSTHRMLEAAAEQAGAQPLILVLGEMLELGAGAAAEHELLGRRIAQTRAAAVFWKGGNVDAVRAGLEAEGFSNPFIPVTDAKAFIREFSTLRLDEGIVLFKGSRGNKLEEFLSAFTRHVRSDSAPEKANPAATTE